MATTLLQREREAIQSWTGARGRPRNAGFHMLGDDVDVEPKQPTIAPCVQPRHAPLRDAWHTRAQSVANVQRCTFARLQRVRRFQILRDHPTLHDMPIVPGLWGCSADAFARVNRELLTFLRRPAHVRVPSVEWVPHEYCTLPARPAGCVVRWRTLK